MLVSPDTQNALASIMVCALQNPEFPAIIEPGGATWTYGQLRREIALLGDLLQSTGLCPGDVFAILVPQGALPVLAVAAALRHCCCAPLNSSLTAPEIESHLVNMRAAALLLTPDFPEARAIALRLGIPVIHALSSQSSWDWQIERPTAPRLHTGRVPDLPADTAVLLNTSATTGVSKLVPLTHANVQAMCEYTRTALALTASDRLLLITPLYHAQGIVSTFAQFLAGGTIVATRGFEAAQYLGWLTGYSPTWYTCAPAIHQAIVTLLENRPLRKPVSLRFVRSSGAAFTVELQRDLGRLLGIPVLNGYGMSETGAVTSDALNLRPYRPGSVGRSVGPTIGIMHPSGAMLPPGEEGEIVVRGPSVMGGYANNPEANHAAFRDGWFRTGDLGRLDADGFLFVTGRSKEMINRGGQKIVPDEVDIVIAAHAAVREAVSFAVPHPTLGEDIACAVVPHPNSSTSEAELRRFASQKLAPFKVPRRIYFVDQIPRGETGKPKRLQLAERLTRKPDPSLLPASEIESLAATLNSATPSDLPDPESNATFRRLVEIWARVLKTDEIDIAEDFFTAGGDSLGAVNLLAEIDLRFGTDLQANAAAFLDNPTLAQVAKMLAETNFAAGFAPVSSDVEIFPVRDEFGKDPIFCVPGDGDEGLYFRRLAKYLAGCLPLSIVRPVNTWHEQSLFTIEQAAERTVEAIRKAQPNGPYTLGGYCYGGIIAFAAAHLLRAQDHTVRLILFDAPMPGFPTPVAGFGCFVARAAAELQQIRRHSGIANPALNFRRLIRRGIWFAVRRARPLLSRYGYSRAMRWTIEQAQQGYLPFYRPHSIDVPILHFLSVDERRPIRGSSRLGWRRMTRTSITEHWVPLDHDRHFRETNLQAISDAIRTWAALTDQVVPHENKEAQLLNV